VVLVNVLDHVEKCYSNDDGRRIFNIINSALANNERVTISLTGITSLNSSFVNSAFIELLKDYDFSYIQKNLKFINSTQQINNIIKNRFSFEIKKQNLAIAN
jgi:hypothetical protein